MTQSAFDPVRYRPLFYLAAAWNLVAAGVALGFPGFHSQTFFADPGALATPAAVLNTRIAWLTVGFFGVGYWIVARDPRKNHALILIAALGKTSVGFLWLAAYQAQTVGLLALAGALGDLVFAGCFGLFLLRARAPRA
ncbi:MAG: hypothetical protein OSB70_11240 [Myxococcota bacterium]|nr:hypothetical protein [Myxococcota bacterium]